MAALVPVVVSDAKLRGRFKKNKQADLKMKMTMSSSASSPDVDEPALKRKLYEKTLRIAGLGPNDKLTDAEILYLEDLIKKNLNAATAEDPFEPEGHHSLLMTDVIVNGDRVLFGSFGSIGGYKEMNGEEFQDDDAFDFTHFTGDDSVSGSFEDPVYIDVKTWDEYICKYCPDDEDDWIDYRKVTPTPAPTPAPTPEPTYGYGCNYCGPDDDEWRTPEPTVAPTPVPSAAPSVDLKPALKEATDNLCAGLEDSPFFRLRNVNFCNFV
ncbi:MAG: hypothetical protein SGARI_004747 [Bacillariaceae sp.]